MKTKLQLSILTMTLSGLAACGGPLTDDKFDGGVRVTINGTVQSVAPSTVGGNRYVALAWHVDDGNGDQLSGQITPVQSTSFPSSFQLGVTVNPEPTQLQDLSDNQDGSDGYIGTGYITIAEDGDDDGVITQQETGDRALAVSDSHVLLFVDGITQAGKDRLQGGYILNTQDLQEGFNLAEFVCSGANETFDHLRVVPNTAVNVRSQADVEADDFPCMNIN